MNNIIIGTAGHVDHGKTTLIQALTGTDTDRLKEEKRRGITIELGFAELKTPDGGTIGIIDVPGHEKFIRNMLAGVGGIDIVLFVVAADEGVMPQTTEHLDIVRLLNIRTGVIAVTKADLVDEEWLALVHSDIREAVQGTFLEQAEIIDVSAKTGMQIDVLRNKLFEMTSGAGEKNEDPALLRMPIDRVFTIEGFGTVITGTLIEGSVHVGQAVSIYPENIQARVRNVQVYGKMVERATAGHRTAINVSGIKKEDLRRGQVLAAVDSLLPSQMFDVRLHILKSQARSVENGNRLHLHVGSDEILCKVILLDQDVLLPGDSGYAQLRTENPLALKQGDHFVVRYYSPVETVGGGIILDANASKHKRKDSDVLQALAIRETGEDADILELAIKEYSRRFISIKSIAMQLGISPEDAMRYAASGEETQTLYRLSDFVYIHADFLEEAARRAAALLEAYHIKNTLSAGMQREEFRSRFARIMRIQDAKHLEKLIELLADNGVIAWRSEGVSLPDFQIQYTQEQQHMRAELLKAYKQWGHEPKDTEEALAAYKNREDGRHILAALAAEGQIVRLNQTTYMDAEILKKIIASIRNRIDVQGHISLAELRDELSTSRKFAMQILEYCDTLKITRMDGERRVAY